MSKDRILALFDFDKTIIKKDSFIIFCKFAARNILERSLVLILSICCKIKLITNSKYKEIILSQIWSNQNYFKKEAILKKLHNKLRSLKNFAVYDALRQHLELGHDVIIISASPDFYLKPFIRQFFNSIEVYASEIRFKNNEVKIDNLYGLQKEIIAKEIIKNKKPNKIWVYTDNLSDLPLIKLADRVILVNPSSTFSRRLKELRIKFDKIE